jgi:hypothetical protein
MTRSLVEAWGLRVKWPSTNDAHSWLRRDDRRTMRPTGRGEYGNNRVQEIVSGTQLANVGSNIARAARWSEKDQQLANRPSTVPLNFWT